MDPGDAWYLVVAAVAIGVSVVVAEQSLLAALCLFLYGGLSGLRVVSDPVRNVMTDHRGATTGLQIGLLVVALAAMYW